MRLDISRRRCNLHEDLERQPEEEEDQGERGYQVMLSPSCSSWEPQESLKTIPEKLQTLSAMREDHRLRHGPARHVGSP